ncbi:MAG: hypothetical protein ACM3ZR_12900 [Pseudomonadota bacterium]
METIKFHFLSKIRPLMIALPVNLLIGLIYCLISKKMSIISYSNVLLMIGGLYAGIGGLCYIGADNIRTANKMLISRDSDPRKTERSSDTNFNMTILLTGISTILISYVIGTFR